ncbi:MAG: hypothetical protein KJO07_10840, partial [Deltaproteobacteria bacterium]|nr:hypothetical protein [Deltaproteobacteria bacterium]
MALLALAGGCTTPGTSPEPSEDLGPDGLYADFFDGKFDAYGHPLGAEVVRIPADCDSSAGVSTDSWLWPDRSQGLGCAASVPVGTGPYAVNLRVNAPAACAGTDCADEVLTITLRQGDVPVAERQVEASALTAGENNVSLRWTSQRAGEVEIDVTHHSGTLGLGYVEVFRTSQTVRIEPASGPDVAADDLIRIDYQGHDPDAVELELSCNGQPVNDALQALIDDGLARREAGDFRALIEAPAELLDGCEPPRSLLVRARRSFGRVAAARATYGIEAPDCSFQPGTTRVLLPGFEPFPADASGH